MKILLQLMLNPIYLFIFTIALLSFCLWIKSKRRQRDIQKGIEKALKNKNKKTDYKQ